MIWTFSDMFELLTVWNSQAGVRPREAEECGSEGQMDLSPHSPSALMNDVSFLL